MKFRLALVLLLASCAPERAAAPTETEARQLDEAEALLEEQSGNGTAEQP